MAPAARSLGHRRSRRVTRIQICRISFRSAPMALVSDVALTGMTYHNHPVDGRARYRLRYLQRISSRRRLRPHRIPLPAGPRQIQHSGLRSLLSPESDPPLERRPLRFRKVLRQERVSHPHQTSQLPLPGEMSRLKTRGRNRVVTPPANGPTPFLHLQRLKG